jgi:pimeloyl-ACP methyl ester carboxylesterase
MAPAEVAERYFTSLIAPGKELVWFENSAHFPQWEDSAHFPQWEERTRFHEFLLETVLPAIAA